MNDKCNCLGVLHVNIHITNADKCPVDYSKGIHSFRFFQIINLMFSYARKHF